MKKFFMVGLFLALAACSTAEQATVQGGIAKLQTTMVNACMVVQPALASAALLDPALAAVSTANGLACATAASVTPTSVQTIISTGIPAIEDAINKSTLIAADQKPILVGLLGIFQMTLTNALAVYGQQIVAPVPASTPVAASGAAL